MDLEEIKKTIREVVRYNWIRLTNNCQAAMDERRLTMDDLLQVLLWGTPVACAPNPDSQNLVCTVEGTDTEQRKLVVKVLILEKGMALLCLEAKEKRG